MTTDFGREVVLSRFDNDGAQSFVFYGFSFAFSFFFDSTFSSFFFFLFFDFFSALFLFSFFFSFFSVLSFFSFFYGFFSALSIVFVYQNREFDLVSFELDGCYVDFIANDQTAFVCYLTCQRIHGNLVDSVSFLFVDALFVSVFLFVVLFVFAFLFDFDVSSAFVLQFVSFVGVSFVEGVH